MHFCTTKCSASFLHSYHGATRNRPEGTWSCGQLCVAPWNKNVSKLKSKFLLTFCFFLIGIHFVEHFALQNAPRVAKCTKTKFSCALQKCIFASGKQKDQVKLKPYIFCKRKYAYAIKIYRFTTSNSRFYKNHNLTFYQVKHKHFVIQNSWWLRHNLPSEACALWAIAALLPWVHFA